MKLSELRQACDDLLAEHGDLHVYIMDSEWCTWDRVDCIHMYDLVEHSSSSAKHCTSEGETKVVEIS